jgi:hypothetical protein
VKSRKDVNMKNRGGENSPKQSMNYLGTVRNKYSN